MKKAIHPNTPYGKGSTEFHTAFPPQPPLPGTALGTVIYHPGPVLPRQQHNDSGAESSLADRWRALVKRVKTKVKQWQARIRRYYLTRMRKHVALTTKPTFRFVRLIAFPVRVSRWMWFRRPALPYGVLTQVVHDRRFALFRRRAVRVTIFRLVAYHHLCSQSILGDGGPVSR